MNTHDSTAPHRSRSVLMRHHMALSILFFVVSSVMAGFASAASRVNVLLIAIDDLRPALGCYDHPTAKTPAMDSLADVGVRFDRAYCQVPLCNPSRASLLTGRYPSTTRVLDNEAWFRETIPDVVTLPEHFRSHGYTTARTGKILHGGLGDIQSWDTGGQERTRFPSNLDDRKARKREQARRAPYSRNRPWHAQDDDDGKPLGDVETAAEAVELLGSLKNAGKPFFLGVGFAKPHTPFIAPKKFFDLHDPARVELPADFSSKPPAALPGAPAVAIPKRNGDLFSAEAATPEAAREAIAAYNAAVSFTDAQIGRVLAALDDLDLRDNTIVVLFGDHGFHLGEKGKWSKHGSLYEPAARVPLIISTPESSRRGKVSERTVELVDIYPTLLEIAGLPASEGVQGQSLVPLIDNPDAKWDHPAFTVVGQHWAGRFGASIRTERYRYTEWEGPDGGAELYDYRSDPAEQKNLAAAPAHATTVAELARRLHASPAFWSVGVDYKQPAAR
ncbi:MAG: sulfatase [Opitutaceae bacterium]